MIPYPHIDPVALLIGPITIHGHSFSLPIRWYSLAYLTGFLLGWRYMLHIVKLDGDAARPGERWGRLTALLVDDFLSWAVVGVIAGGRFGYILFYNPSLYFHHPAEMIRLWDGGMSFHGGAAGMIIAMIVFSIRRKIHVLRLTDAVCAAVPIGLFFGRLANFINGELYGRMTTVPWGMVFPSDRMRLVRHPSQLYEAGLEGLTLFLILAALIHTRRIRERPGIVSAVFLLGYAAARLTLENFREPDEQLGFIVGHATMGQLLCIPMIVGALVLLWWSCLRKRRSIA